MARIVFSGRIDGEFEGFEGDRLFKMMDGTYWIQVQYEFWYHYAYQPEATIMEDGGRYTLTVAGRSIQVRRETNVIESYIDGEFRGWEGETAYRLTNGQVWQQAAYKYEYSYAYRPEVLIYPGGGGMIMSVAGTEAEVRRVR